jgi:hypothetical protein
MWLLEGEPEEVRDPPRALVLARRAVVELDGAQDPEFLDTLALALFLTGDREGALREERRALKLLPAKSRDKRDATIRKALEANLARFRGGEEIGKESASAGE